MRRRRVATTLAVLHRLTRGDVKHGAFSLERHNVVGDPRGQLLVSNNHVPAEVDKQNVRNSTITMCLFDSPKEGKELALHLVDLAEVEQVLSDEGPALVRVGVVH